MNNFLVRFNCECWGKPSCSHGSSAVTVVIRDCELAYPVGSVVDQLTNSKALKVLYLAKHSRRKTFTCRVENGYSLEIFRGSMLVDLYYQLTRS